MIFRQELEELINRHCPVCGSDDLRVSKRYRDGNIEMNCKNCDHHWVVEADDDENELWQDDEDNGAQRV